MKSFLLKVKLVSWAFSFLGLVLSIQIAYAQDQIIDNGIAYLRATQNPDGSWGGTATSLNTLLQTTAATARALQLLGVTDSGLTDAVGFLSAQTPNTVDDLSHQVEVLAALGADVI